MNTYAIAYDPATGRDDEIVRASYHRPSDLGDFVEFKDESHAVVFAVRSAYVVSIRRSENVLNLGEDILAGPIETHLNRNSRR